MGSRGARDVFDNVTRQARMPQRWQLLLLCSLMLCLYDCGLRRWCCCASRWRRGRRRTLRWRVWHGWRLAWPRATIVAWSMLVNRAILQVKLSNGMADRAFTAGFTGILWQTPGLRVWHDETSKCPWHTGEVVCHRANFYWMFVWWSLTENIFRLVWD